MIVEKCPGNPDKVDINKTDADCIDRLVYCVNSDEQ